MRVMVIGLGYVGSVVAAGLAKAGHSVTGIDISFEKVKSFQNGILQTREPGLADLIINAINKQKFKAFHISEIERIDHPIIIICVGTPTQIDGTVDIITGYGCYNMDYIEG